METELEISFTQQLIDKVSAEPILYNTYHYDKKNRNKVNNVWLCIAQSVNSTVMKLCTFKLLYCTCNVSLFKITYFQYVHE